MSNLQVKEIKGISFKNEIKFAVCHDEFYLFSDNRDNIYTFDSNTISNATLPPPDKKIRGNITSLDFSPSRKYAAVGYSDGGLQVFDLDTNKPYKLLSKPNNNHVQNVMFYSDTFLLATLSNGIFLAYKISFITRDNVIIDFKSKPLGLYRPAIYRYVEGKEKSSKIILPNFMDNFVVSTEKSLNFSLLSKDFVSSKSKYEIPIGNLIPCFYTVDSRTILMAVVYADKIEVYSIIYAESLQIKKQSTISTSYQLSFLSFLSSMILIGHDQNCQHFLMFSLDTNTSNELDSPISGFSIQGSSNNGPVFFKDSKLYRLSLQPFTSTIELYSDSVEDAEKAINFCKKAISNDPLATIGLPNNQNQRNLVIERSISQILANYLSDQLTKDASNASQIADNFIKISQDLNLNDWIINQAVPIFEEKGLIDLIIEKVIQADPTASLFTYNRKFVESIIRNAEKVNKEEENGISVSNFLLALPNRILPPIEIIKFAEKVGSNFLLAQVYAIRLGDIKSALKVLANADLFSNVCIIIIHNQDKISTSLRWAFTFSEGKFPYLEKICRCKDANDVFQLFECTIDEKRGRISVNDYVNAMIQTLYTLQKDKENTENIEFINSYLAKMENMILQKRIRLLSSTLKCLVSIIFAKKLPENDTNKKRYEKLLIYILSSDVPVQFKDHLLQLCGPFEFSEAKRRMEEGARKYESTIKENLFDPSKDVFNVINDMLYKAKSNKNELTIAETSIKNLMFSFAPIFIVKDVKQFSNLICTKFPESALAVIREVSDENMKNIFIRNLYESNAKIGANKDFLRLPSDMFLKYAFYLSNYYPKSVLNLIQLYQGTEIPLEELIPICEEHMIYDSLAFLHELTNDASKASDDIVNFQQTELLLFAQGKTDIQRGREVTSFIVRFVKERVKKKAILDETRKMSFQLVNAMLAPLYYLQKEFKETEKNEEIVKRTNFLTSYLKEICSTVANVISYPALLEIFIHKFQELNFGYAKLALSTIMNDYAYDLDTTNAMCELYRQDEINDHSKFILNAIRGTENDGLVCNTCKKRLNGGMDQIQIFPCGHVFHRNFSCLPKQICPVCNPEERLDQDIPPPTQSVNIGRSQLRRFEFMLKKHDSVFRIKEISEMKKDQIVINPDSLVSFG